MANDMEAVEEGKLRLPTVEMLSIEILLEEQINQREHATRCV